MTLELRNVTKRFPGVLAVDNVSFSAPAGQITGYLGPNGSGKSTTMKMIAGLIEIGSGEILFDGQPRPALPRRPPPRSPPRCSSRFGPGDPQPPTLPPSSVSASSSPSSHSAALRNFPSPAPTSPAARISTSPSCSGSTSSS